MINGSVDSGIFFEKCACKIENSASDDKSEILGILDARIARGKIKIFEWKYVDWTKSCKTVMMMQIRATSEFIDPFRNRMFRFPSFSISCILVCHLLFFLFFHFSIFPFSKTTVDVTCIQPVLIFRECVSWNMPSSIENAE
jgi:hypothetical protein